MYIYLVLVLGVLAIIFAVLNIIWYVKGRNPKIFRYISLSFTLLAVLAGLSEANSYIAMEDISALYDVVLTLTSALWICVIGSICVNSVTLIERKNHKKCKQ